MFPKALDSFPKQKASVYETYEDNLFAVLAFMQEMLSLFILRLKLGYHRD